MRRLFSKIATLSVGLAMAVGVGVAINSGRKSALPVSAIDPLTTNIGYSQSWTDGSGKSTSGTSSSGSEMNATISPFTIKLSKGYKGQSNAYTQDYAGGVITLTGDATVGTIDQVVITASGNYSGLQSDGSFTISGGGTGASASGTASTATLTKGNSGTPTNKWTISHTKQIRFTNIAVTYTPAKEINHIAASAKVLSGWYNGDSFKTSDVTVTPYYSEDDSDAGTPITNGAGVKFGESADKDSVTLVEGNNAIKVTYLSKSTTINVTAGATPVISGVVLSGDMTNKSYSLNDDWNYSGLYLTVSWTEGKADTTVQLASATFTADPAKANNTSTTSISISGTYQGFEFSKTITGITVLAVPTTVTISGAGDSGTTQWKPSGNGDTFVDSAGNTATFNTDVKAAGFSGDGTPMQFGKNDEKGTYVLITIPLAQRAGVTAAAMKYCSNGGTTVEGLIYGDTENDVILSTSVTGNTATEKKTTDDGINYETINASTIHFKVSFNVGCKIGYFSYTLGDKVQEFDIFTSLAIQEETTDTQFKVGDTFSASGLVLRATDNAGLTKDFTSGIKFGTAENDDSYNGYKFVADDATNSPLTIYASLTIGGITKSVTYEITVTEVPTYSLVSDLDDLYEGAKVLIVYGTKAAAAYGTNYLTAATVAYTDDKITNSGDAIEFTVRIYGSKIAFQFGAYYLSYSGSLNQIQRSNTLNDSCGFYNNGTGLLSNVNNRYLQHWETNPEGFACLTNNYTNANHVSIYISDKSVDSDAVRAETYAYRYLHMRDYLVGDGSCMTYYGTAKTAFESLTDGQKAEFIKLTEAVERLQAWADANGEAFDPVNKTFTKLFVEKYIKGSSANYAIIIIAITASITALGLTLMIVKKKKHN